MEEEGWSRKRWICLYGVRKVVCCKMVARAVPVFLLSLTKICEMVEVEEELVGCERWWCEMAISG